MNAPPRRLGLVQLAALVGMLGVGLEPRRPRSSSHPSGPDCDGEADCSCGLTSTRVDVVNAAVVPPNPSGPGVLVQKGDSWHTKGPKTVFRVRSDAEVLAERKRARKAAKRLAERGHKE